MQRKTLSEYLELQDAVRTMQLELQNEDAVQQSLREQIAVFHNMLKEIFTKYWPPLRERQVE